MSLAVSLSLIIWVSKIAGPVTTSGFFIRVVSFSKSGLDAEMREMAEF